ncbi:aminotransferase class IV [Neolewinella sp.]|uniref:aminotransferase class IV n=1 Tax=Neolewinella sp. TaxID=2993543 RepID=UPI003B52C176
MPAFKLADVLDKIDLPPRGTHKLRLIYASELSSYQITPYEVGVVRSLRVVAGDGLHYGRKYADRQGITDLYAQRGECDDILIVQRGYLTDTSYANIALYDGSQWYTPAWPLLRGTRREQLLQAGVLRPSVIRLRDLQQFECIRLINAMLPWGEGPRVATSAVRGVHRLLGR